MTEEQPLAAQGTIDGHALDRLLSSIQERSEAFIAGLDALPPTKACESCVGGRAKFNRKLSEERMEHVYECPHCMALQAARRLERKIERVGIPADVRHATLANFRIDRTNINAKAHHPALFVDTARKFIAGALRNVFFAGTCGIGKGHLAAAIAREFLKAGKSVKWTTCAKLFREYHKAYESSSTELVIEAHSDSDLLVLDEICLRDLPSDGEEILFEIMDRRQKNRLQSVLMANKSASHIRDWLGGRVSDRLRSGTVAFCYGEWDSMRGADGDGAGNKDLEF